MKTTELKMTATVGLLRVSTKYVWKKPLNNCSSAIPSRAPNKAAF